MGQILDNFKNIIKNETSKEIIGNKFLAYYEDVNQDFLVHNIPISEELALELIDMGDYVEQENIIFDKNKKDTFLTLCNRLKNLFGINSKDFYEECEKFLFSLEASEVRNLERFYKWIISLKMDFDIKILYDDGLVFCNTFSLENLKDINNVLEFKSYIAKVMKTRGVIFLDFLNVDLGFIYTYAFIYDEKFLALQEKYVKTVHVNNKLKRQVYMAHVLE